MRTFLILALVVAAAMAVPVNPADPREAVVLRYDFDNIGVDGYTYNVETSDGKTAQEQGSLKNVGSENEALEVRGQYSYTAPDGQVYSVTYIANENGFQPQGAHIPQ